LDNSNSNKISVTVTEKKPTAPKKERKKVVSHPSFDDENVEENVAIEDANSDIYI